MGLSKEAVVREAVALADESGTGAPSMRALAKRLGVEAMSLYHHFRTKDLIVDGMVDAVFAEIDLPAADAPWRAALRLRGVSAHRALIRHPWAVSLMDSRKNPGPATLRHHDAVIGCLRSAGFSVAGAVHAFSVLDSYVYGFAIQQLSLPSEPPADPFLPDDEYPHLAELIAQHSGKTDYAEEFEIGLDLILDGLETRRERWT